MDLGVGLWAWPLPVDYDDDGDYDLVVSCPDVPYNGAWLFENPGPATEKTPVFKPAVRISRGLTNIQICYVEGKPVVLSPGRSYPDFKKSGLDKPLACAIKPELAGHPGRIRAHQWKYTDYNGDGRTDLMIGIGCWGDYGWDDAFDANGEWTRGPLRGFVYVVLNKGTNEAPSWEAPSKLQAGERPVETFGMPSPNLADFDDDGDLDLLCGEFVDGFTYFENTGTRTAPQYAAGRRLTTNGAPLTMELCMITPTAIDWDRDGDIDLICGDEDGRVALIEHTGRIKDHCPVFLPPVYFKQQADHLKFGALATPWSVDWDSDGDEDLLCGNTAGCIAFIENLDGGDPPSWAAPVLLKAGGEPIRIQAGINGSIQGPCERKWGYTTLSTGDWNHDGLPDIMANSIWGKVIWYENIGKKGKPELAPARPVTVIWPEGTTPPKPAWNWWNPKGNELATQWRTTPVMIDWNRDGINDLIMLDHEGYPAFFERSEKNGKCMLLPPKRIFFQQKGGSISPLRLNSGKAGRSGRRKLCFTDWDGDGDLDLIANSKNAELWCTVKMSEEQVVMQHRGSLCTKRLAGHTTSPTIVDWDHDGAPDLLLGAEDGHFYYLKHPEPLSYTTAAGTLTITGHLFSMETLTENSTAFNNRTYVWKKVPPLFENARYTRLSGGVKASVLAKVTKDCTLFITTASNTKEDDLEGWKQLSGTSFYYTDKGKTSLSVFYRDGKAGETVSIPQLHWTGSMLLIPLTHDHQSPYKKAGFTPLFPTGAITDNWKVTSWSDLSRPAPEGASWDINDSMLYGSTPRGTWLVSEKEYDNFQLAFDFKLGPRGNSGCALRAPMKGDPAFDGLELQMADLRYNPSAKDSELTGGFYRAAAPRRQVYLPEKWNRYHIVLNGPQITVLLNHILIHHISLDDFSDTVPRHDGTPAPPLKDRPRRGHIGFQELSRGGDRVTIRSPVIKPIVRTGRQ